MRAAWAGVLWPRGAGVDKAARLLVVFSICNMPPRDQIDLDKLIRCGDAGMPPLTPPRYMLFTLDKVVNSDYSIVYFHHGVNSAVCRREGGHA